MTSIILCALLATLVAPLVPGRDDAFVQPNDAASTHAFARPGAALIGHIADLLNQAKDREALELFAENVEIMIVGNGSKQPQGRNGLEQALQRARRIAPEAQIQLLKIFSHDELFIVHYQLRGKTAIADGAPAGAAPITAGCLAFITVKDGRVVRWENYHNPLAFIQPTAGIRAGLTLEADHAGEEVIKGDGHPDNADLIERYYQAVNADSDIIRATFFAPGAKIRNQANGFFAHGLDQIKARWNDERGIFPQRLEQLTQIDLAGEYVIVRSSVLATYRGTQGVEGTEGKEIVFHPAAIYRLRDGHIESVDYFYNEIEFIIQLGTTVP